MATAALGCYMRISSRKKGLGPKTQVSEALSSLRRNIIRQPSPWVSLTRTDIHVHSKTKNYWRTIKDTQGLSFLTENNSLLGHEFASIINFCDILIVSTKCIIKCINECRNLSQYNISSRKSGHRYFQKYCAKIYPSVYVLLEVFPHVYMYVHLYILAYCFWKYIYSHEHH